MCTYQYFLQTFFSNLSHYSKSSKWVYLKILQDLQENTVSFVIKLQDASSSFKNETLAQMFPCEFFRISKNIFLYRTPWNNCFSTAIVRWLNFHTIEIIIKQILTATLLKCFSGVLWTYICLLWCFFFKKILFDVFIVNFQQIFILWSTFPDVSFKNILSHLLGWIKTNKIDKGLHSSNLGRYW